VAETLADRNSYGFREGRRCADAIDAGFKALAEPNSATWILEGDIQGCFDNICPNWMLENIPMDRGVLHKWLRTRYIEEDKWYPGRKGTPQGGIISPTIANMVLDGMEQTIKACLPRRRCRVNFIRYADDFIVTAKSKRLLERYVQPAIERFLAERGLQLSAEKTVITHIHDGFTFLGQTFRKTGGNVLQIKPAKEGVLALQRKVGELIRKHVSAPMPILIKKLNQTLRGWGNYHRHVVASEAFSRIDTYVYEQLWRMLRHRHPNKSKGWLIRKYWSTPGQKWVFSALEKTKKKGKRLYQVVRLSALGIRRYVKIQADANPYLPQYGAYFWSRRHKKETRLLPALSAREYRAQIT
jgi:RNA-directed DNA polymerase